MALPENRSNTIDMPLDYLNEASEEVKHLFNLLDGVERTLRAVSEKRRPMIGEERYMTGEEVCAACTFRRGHCRHCGIVDRFPSPSLATDYCSILNRVFRQSLTAIFEQ